MVIVSCVLLSHQELKRTPRRQCRNKGRKRIGNNSNNNKKEHHNFFIPSSNIGNYTRYREKFKYMSESNPCMNPYMYEHSEICTSTNMQMSIKQEQREDDVHFCHYRATQMGYSILIAMTEKIMAWNHYCCSCCCMKSSHFRMDTKLMSLARASMRLSK